MSRAATRDPHTTAVEMTGRHRLLIPRLAVLMLLEFLVYGSWNATVGLVLVDHGLGSIVGTLFALAALAAIVSPMLVGSIADRFIPSQWVLAGISFIGGGIMLLVPGTILGGSAALVLTAVFIYMLLFQPTVALVNSVSFLHLGHRPNIFPYIRVFGTFGWIIAGLLVGQLGLSSSTNLFYVTAIASFVMGAYCLTLPHTPPLQRGARFHFGDVIGAQALKLFKQRNFVIFAICAVLTFIPIAMYNSFSSTLLSSLGFENVASVLVIGQVSEVAFIPAIPWVLKRFGMKYVLLIGMVSWGVRFALFFAATGGQAWWAIIAVAIHGICNDFFLTISFMYAERIAPESIKAQSQSLVLLLTQGVGIMIGSFLAGGIYNATVGAAGTHAPLSAWAPFLVVPIVVSVVVAILFAVFFRRKEENGNPDEIDVPRAVEVTP
ncbi:MFS transporter [Curtobacterium pusillum]|uniref:MFS transporter n=1 Tax=Curtobacterium pusillum TaxID=69373 RepID=UPI0011A79D9A|nr:MFS transporter [Curtobacterium pusillum]